MKEKCPHCQAELPDVQKKLDDKDAKIAELEAAIKAAREADTKEEADNIFDGV